MILCNNEKVSVVGKRHSEMKNSILKAESSTDVKVKLSQQ